MKTYQVKVWRRNAYRTVKHFNDLGSAFDCLKASKSNAPDQKFRLIGLNGEVLRAL